MYLTDNLLVPTKWRIPDNNPAATIVSSGGYLLIWADEDTTDAGLHANFKLDAGGEQIGLFDSDGVTVIDSVIFDKHKTYTSYAESYFGGKKEDYDVIKTESYQTSCTDGSIDAGTAARAPDHDSKGCFAPRLFVSLTQDRKKTLKRWR